ncbi:hypothetical protein [Deinococcus aerophilus]|uniref:Uncharacterized protein n=1 Tax=Deinococcus aerophilus TaxID=522488 RepID=A0ABQ2GLT9_9DEIO|nr:hypothetical protein [Deinococcus aerophilus]GGM00806.1 hypothetical protein GCM10010841_06720 [Deinococcus aerophilus]
MKNVLVFTAALTLIPLASAQQNGSAQNRQMTPEMRARMAQMQPINDLSQTVRLLPDLEKNKATAMTKTQAKSLLTLLGTLQKASAIQPNDAKKYLAQIEDKILTDKQLTALDDLMLKAEQQRTAQRTQRQAGGTQGGAGVRIPGLPGGGLGGGAGGGGQRSGGQGGNGANSGQNAQGGQFDPTKFNPFKQGRGADALKAYIAVLQKK